MSALTAARRELAKVTAALEYASARARVAAPGPAAYAAQVRVAVLGARAAQLRWLLAHQESSSSRPAADTLPVPPAAVERHAS